MSDMLYIKINPLIKHEFLTLFPSKRVAYDTVRRIIELYTAYAKSALVDEEKLAKEVLRENLRHLE